MGQLTSERRSGAIMFKQKERIRDLGYEPGQKWLKPGPLNSITDVAGVCIGIKTLHSGDITSPGPMVRTGVTSILARPGTGVMFDPVHASIFQLNGTGEMTSSHLISETGVLHSPILIGGTTSLGAMLDGVAKWSIKAPEEDEYNRPRPPFVLPCVAETLDTLTDLTAFSVKVDDALDALSDSKEKRLPHEIEGSLGGGTGMCCQGFKAGNGTSSRVIPSAEKGKSYTLGAFVQANFGTARDFIINGLPIGKALIASGFHGDEKKKAEQDYDNAKPWNSKKDGSIVILATDMPLVPHQLNRLCKRTSIGLAHVGAIAHNMSGDIFMASSTQSTVPPSKKTFSSSSPSLRVGPLGISAVETNSTELITESSFNTIFYAVADVVEEAVLNALCAAKDEQGANVTSAKGLPHKEVQELLARAKHALDPIFPGVY